jgi:hypothetical protein
MVDEGAQLVEGRSGIVPIQCFDDRFQVGDQVIGLTGTEYSLKVERRDIVDDGPGLRKLLSHSGDAGGSGTDDGPETTGLVSGACGSGPDRRAGRLGRRDWRKFPLSCG